MGTAPNQYYEGVVSHFSVWNADQVYDSVAVSYTHLTLPTSDLV